MLVTKSLHSHTQVFYMEKFAAKMPVLSEVMQISFLFILKHMFI